MRWSSLLLGAAATLVAATAGARTPPGGEIVEKQAVGGFEYATGGVGETEQVIMESRYDDYSFKLVNVRSGPEAAYVAKVDVTITDDAGGKVLETTTTGPWLVADLPAGEYEVTASFDGATHTRDVTIPSGDTRERRVMDWHTG
ncbi:hypothetical protein PC39_07214 [Salinisphaera sp. PC39]|uniref:carboxypeptidase-like regulatory domain-containing protein n=1 Tax=Salinisphaera sp. PC39 TaxID=1304156 RepID=UPI00333FC425